MTEYIQTLRRRFVEQREQDRYRQPPLDPYALARTWAAEGLEDTERACRRLQAVLELPQWTNLCNNTPTSPLDANL